MIHIKACGLSDIGRTRAHNEDCFRVDSDHQLYIVADGMGGHSHGEVASGIAVDSIQEFVTESEDYDLTWPYAYDTELGRHSNRLKTAIRIAHDKVLRAIRQDGSLHGMGTTVVSVLVKDQIAAVAHVGDSRAYRLREGCLEQLTEDHTWVNEQVVAGHLSREQARAHPLKNVVTRALGGESNVVVDLSEIAIQPGDRYLLCSDGLTSMLQDPEIQERMEADGSLKEICERLIEDANQRGGLDNVTVVVLRVEDD